MKGKIIVIVMVSAILITIGVITVNWWVSKQQPSGGGGIGGRVFTIYVPDDPEVIARHNHGAALMGQFKFSEAVEVFEALENEFPSWMDVKVNLSIATLNRQREGDEVAALALLDEVIAIDPDHLRAHFCAGLLRDNDGDFETARRHYKLVTKADPDDAYAAYYYGKVLAVMEENEAAIGEFHRALRLEPYLRTVYYALGQLQRRQGEIELAKHNLDVFQRLNNNPRARIADLLYTKMGPKAVVLAINLAKPKPKLLPQGDIFNEPAPLLQTVTHLSWKANKKDRPYSITACDIDGNGTVDLFIAGGLNIDGDQANAVLFNDGNGGFSPDLNHPLTRIQQVNAALWGDYDNDGLTDVYLCRNGPNQLWRRTERGKWEDVTESTGTANESYNTVDGAFFSADHDIDLDIFCVNADGPNELLNNNSDGTFQPIAQEQGIAGDGRSSQQVIIDDLDGDRDADIVVINTQPPHEVYINDRLWEYHTDEEFGDFCDHPFAAVVAGDPDATGQAEIITIDHNGKIERWRPDDSGQWIAKQITTVRSGSSTLIRQLVLLDLTGDGVPWIVTFDDSGFTAMNLDHPADGTRFEASSSSINGWATVVLDSSRGHAIVGLPVSDGLPARFPGQGSQFVHELAKLKSGPQVWQPGRGRHDFAAVQIIGQKASPDGKPPARSNASGIGSRLFGRVDSIWMSANTFRNSSGPGQSLQPVLLGLAGYPNLEYLRIDWSDGVMQTEIHGISPKIDTPPRDFTAGHVETIEEIQRQTGSCPVLFAWNGTKYEFVSDILGVGGIGFFLKPDQYSTPRPWENFMLPDGALQPKDGRFVIKINEPMEEACYLDSVKLVAYDLPPGWKMTVDERMATGGPDPTGEPLFYRQMLSPMAVVNERNEDVLESVKSVDHVAAPVGELDRRFLGRLAGEHVLTLTFDQPINGGTGTPVLIADGWVEYPYSQTMFSAWQAEASYDPPTIEARGADGRWQVVLDRFGYPAGFPRQMSVPLLPANLPAGTRELRIRTNLEIYWDRLAVAWTETCEDVNRVELPLLNADVRRSGFATCTTGDQRLAYYDYDHRLQESDFRHQAGAYTKYGPATDLVSSHDDMLAIIGPGEEVHVEFNASLPPVVTGWNRVFVLESAGWCKDMDIYTRTGETLAPIPANGRQTWRDGAPDSWLNSRYEP